ncbi:MAG: amidohydrolase [Chloroflexota bacterium]|nr:amidohydrolase [Chloroflexota bacterium]
MTLPTVQELKALALEAIERHEKEIIAVSRSILHNPETGFTEHKTSQLVVEQFSRLGVPHHAGLAITGVKGCLDGGAGPGPSVAILGELDSLRIPDHPFADPVTGAAHACGHHAQIGMMLGATIGLLAPGVLPCLSGKVIPFAVPAEEFIEVERRLRLREMGRIMFLGGKQELIRLGEFDDVDMAMMCHTAADLGGRAFAVGGTSNGNVVKYVRYQGRAAHAGGAPHMGINALNAAMLALMSINANRETFRDQDVVRIHGILTRGGESVNSVPSDVRLEWRVRSGSPRALVKNAATVDRCFKAGAMAVGARVSITTIPGYLAMRNDQTLQAIFHENAAALLGQEQVAVVPSTRNRGGSTDMGDVSQIMPACHPYAAGASGSGHSKDYLITDWRRAVIEPARIMACVAIDLLANGAAKAKEVLTRHKPAMTREEYLAFQRARATVEEYEGPNK